VRTSQQFSGSQDAANLPQYMQKAEKVVQKTNVRNLKIKPKILIKPGPL